MDPRCRGIKGGDKALEIRGNSLVFPVAIARRIRPLAAADLLRLLRRRFLAPTFLRLGLGPLARRFNAGLDLGSREFWRSAAGSHLEIVRLTLRLGSLHHHGMNIVRTALLMAGLSALFLFVGFLIGGEAGMMIALVFATATNLFAYWNSDRVLLSMYGARPVDETSSPDLV